MGEKVKTQRSCQLKCNKFGWQMTLHLRVMNKKEYLPEARAIYLLKQKVKEAFSENTVESLGSSLVTGVAVVAAFKRAPFLARVSTEGSRKKKNCFTLQIEWISGLG